MNLRPLVVTGPIGSGKSTVSKLIEGFGARRVDLDQLSKEVLESPEGVRFVRDTWPEVVSDHVIDRQALGRAVFGDPGQLRALEEFVHPRVLSVFGERFARLSPLVVEISVPFQITIAGATVAMVDASVAHRRKRLLERGMSAADIADRMAAQPPRASWLALADVVVSNVGEKSKLEPEVKRLWTSWTEKQL